MSTIQITIPDALRERMTSEEIRLFLEAQLKNLEATKPAIPAIPASIPLENEPFIGMWADREEMNDSVEYVRNLRRSMNRVHRWAAREQAVGDIKTNEQSLPE